MPNEEKTYWARYSDRLPSCKLVAIDPTEVPCCFLTRSFFVSFFLIRDLALVFIIHQFLPIVASGANPTFARMTALPTLRLHPYKEFDKTEMW